MCTWQHTASSLSGKAESPAGRREARMPSSPVQGSSEGRGASHRGRKPMCTALFAEQGLQGFNSSCPLLWLYASIDLRACIYRFVGGK